MVDLKPNLLLAAHGCHHQKAVVLRESVEANQGSSQSARTGEANGFGRPSIGRQIPVLRFRR